MEIFETVYGKFNIYVNLLLSEEENLAHISFVDKTNKTHIIIMQQLEGKWFFVNSESLPRWITELKDQFQLLATKEVLKNQLMVNN